MQLCQKRPDVLWCCELFQDTRHLVRTPRNPNNEYYLKLLGKATNWGKIPKMVNNRFVRCILQFSSFDTCHCWKPWQFWNLQWLLTMIILTMPWYLEKFKGSLNSVDNVANVANANMGLRDAGASKKKILMKLVGRIWVIYVIPPCPHTYHKNACKSFSTEASYVPIHLFDNEITCHLFKWKRYEPIGQTI